MFLMVVGFVLVEEPKVSPAEIICKDEDDIWLLRLYDGNAKQEASEGEELNRFHVVRGQKVSQAFRLLKESLNGSLYYVGSMAR